jgi:NADH-quinone oxidoreductase subunit E
MLRRLHHTQPDSFAFTPDNQAWAEVQMTKFPPGRQASAVIPLLWRAQEQEGWVSRPAIEYVADMLGMAYIRVLEVCSFYFMFQMQPVGAVAHVQVCGTTTCMICGAEDLIGVCKQKIAADPHVISGDGKFSWEEVECLGACTNAPMVQIGKDFYEDLTAEKFSDILDAFARGEVPVPGPQNGRYAAEPLSGLSSLKEFDSGAQAHNASVDQALALGDTVSRIQGGEVPVLTPWLHDAEPKKSAKPEKPKPEKPKAEKAKAKPAKAEKTKAKKAKPAKAEPVGDRPQEVAGLAAGDGSRPALYTTAPRDADDLKLIKGVGPKLEATLNDLGIYRFEQITTWGAAEIDWVDARLTFKGRILRDDWVAQAKTLAKGGTTDFANKVKKGGVY